MVRKRKPDLGALVEGIEKALDNAEEEAPDYLMWVGALHYPTVDSFIDEARKRGVCKRVGRLPKNFVLGKSRIFFAHDDGMGPENGFIFGYFVPDVLEIIVWYEEDIPDSLLSMATMVLPSEITDEKERGCGFRVKDGRYLMGVIEADDDSALPSEFMELLPVRRLKFYEPDRKRFRGLLQIAWGDSVLATVDRRVFMVPISRNSVQVSEAPKGWTEEQDKRLMTLVRVSPSNSRAAQIYSYGTGRSKPTILYRIAKLLRELEE